MSNDHRTTKITLDNEQNLMSQLGMSESLDSSSSEDIIPMQKRRKRSFTRKRNFRSSLGGRSSFFKSNNFGYGFWTLFKYTAMLFVMIVLLVDFVFIFNAFKRLDMLQLNVHQLQSTTRNQPDEMHSVHAQLARLEMNSSQLRVDLANVLTLVSNLTSEVGELRSHLEAIASSIEAAPAIRQLPNDVEALKKTVAALGSNMNSDDKEVKMTSDELARQKIAITELKGNLEQLMLNTSSVMEDRPTIKRISDRAETSEKRLAEVSDTLAAINATLVHLESKQLELSAWKTSRLKAIEASTRPSTPAHVKRVLPDFPVIPKSETIPDMKIENSSM